MCNKQKAIFLVVVKLVFHVKGQSKNFLIKVVEKCQV